MKGPTPRIRVKPLRVDGIVHLLAELFGENYYIWYRVPGTDIDFIAYTGRRELVIVEVKSTLNDRVLDRAIAQLDFRRHLGNRVYLAVPSKDIYYALIRVPNEYGVIGVAKNKATIYRESRYFNPVAAKYIILSLFSDTT